MQLQVADGQMNAILLAGVGLDHLSDRGIEVLEILHRKRVVLVEFCPRVRGKKLMISRNDIAKVQRKDAHLDFYGATMWWDTKVCEKKKWRNRSNGLKIHSLFIFPQCQSIIYLTISSPYKSYEIVSDFDA